MSVSYGDDFDDIVEETAILDHKQEGSETLMNAGQKESGAISQGADVGPEYSLDFDQGSSMHSLSNKPELTEKYNTPALGLEYSLDFEQGFTPVPIVDNKVVHDSDNAPSVGPEYSLDFDQGPSALRIAFSEIDDGLVLEGARLASALDYSLDFDSTPDAAPPTDINSNKADARQPKRTESADFSFDFDKTSAVLPVIDQVELTDPSADKILLPTAESTGLLQVVAPNTSASVEDEYSVEFIEPSAVLPPPNNAESPKDPPYSDVQLASGLDYSVEFDEPTANLEDGSAVIAFDKVPVDTTEAMDSAVKQYDSVVLEHGGSSIASVDQVDAEACVEAGKHSPASRNSIPAVQSDGNDVQHLNYGNLYAEDVNEAENTEPASKPEIAVLTESAPADVATEHCVDVRQPPICLHDEDDGGARNGGSRAQPVDLVVNNSSAAISPDNDVIYQDNSNSISADHDQDSLALRYQLYDSPAPHTDETDHEKPVDLVEGSLSQEELNEEGEVEYIFEGPAPEPDEDVFYEAGSPMIGAPITRALEEEQEEILYFGQPSPTELLSTDDGVKTTDHLQSGGVSSPPNFALYADQNFQGRPAAESFCSITSSEASNVNTASVSRRVSRASIVGDGVGLRVITPHALTAQHSMSSMVVENSQINATDDIGLSSAQLSESRLHITRSVDEYLGEFAEKKADTPGLLVTQDSFLPGQCVPFVVNPKDNSSPSIQENPLVSVPDTEQHSVQQEEQSIAAGVVNSEVGVHGTVPNDDDTKAAVNEQQQERVDGEEAQSSPEPLVDNSVSDPDRASQHVSDSSHQRSAEVESAQAHYIGDSNEQDRAAESTSPRSREPEQESSPLVVGTVEANESNAESAQPATYPAAGEVSDGVAAKEETGKLPNILSRPKTITIDGLERYVAPQPKKVTDLRNMVQNNRKSAVPKASEVSHRPRNVSPSARPKTASQARSKPATKTFLTDVALQGGSTKRPTTAAQKQQSPPSPCPTSPSKKKHVRYCNPIRFHPKKQCIVLSDVCPHRKAFTKCASFFCKEALEKYNWLIMVREKYRETLELITKVDELWRQKLMKALDECVEEMKADQRRELFKLKKSLEAPSSNDLHMLTTLQYLELTGVNKKTKEEAFMETGLTSDHYEFVHRKVEIHKLHVALQIRTLVDHRKCYHQKLLNELKDIVKMPLKDLDSIRDSQIEAIDFHMKRVERWILYLLDMAMQPSRDNPLEPPKEDVVNVNRISKAARQITEFLRNALAGFAQVCAQIRESYNNADFEVRRMLLEAKTLHLMTEKERPKTAIRPKSPIRQKADQQKVSSIALRPLSAPATTSVSKSLSFFEDRQHDTDDNHGEVDESAHVEAGKSYGSDFEDMVSDSKNNLSRLNSRTSVQSVQSVEDYIVEDVEEKESRQIDGIEEESRGNRSKSRSNNDSYGEDEDHQEAKQQQEEYAKDEVGGFDDQNELMEDQADLKASKKKKSKKGKRSRKVLPTGNELRENLQLAKVKDDKVARKQLLFKLLDRSNPPTNSTGRPYTSPPRTRSPPPISNTSYQRDFEFDSNLDEQDDKHNPLPPVRMCFHCYKEIVGRGVHTPKLTTSGKESWQVAQTDLSRTNSRFPDHLRKIEIGAEIFDLSKTFLAKLQASATNVSQGEPAFCTWECVKKWALGHCPLQHRYQTDILINMAAGYLVDV